MPSLKSLNLSIAVL